MSPLCWVSVCPNITGWVGELVWTAGGVRSNGAFTSKSNGRAGGRADWYFGEFSLDASRSSNYYGSNAVVQPKSFQTLIIIKT